MLHAGYLPLLVSFQAPLVELVVHQPPWLAFVNSLILNYFGHFVIVALLNAVVGEDIYKVGLYVGIYPEKEKREQ